MRGWSIPLGVEAFFSIISKLPVSASQTLSAYVGD